MTAPHAETSGTHSALSVWRPQREPRRELVESNRDEVEAEMCEHFEALNELIGRLGHGRANRLELRLVDNAFDYRVIFRWDRPR